MGDGATVGEGRGVGVGGGVTVGRGVGSARTVGDAAGTALASDGVAVVEPSLVAGGVPHTTSASSKIRSANQEPARWSVWAIAA